MLIGISTILAPDYCCGCGKIGQIICEGCRYNITSEPFSHCIVCLMALEGSKGSSNLCRSCNLLYRRAWTLGFREESLEKLVNLSKFGASRAGCRAQAELLYEIVDSLPSDTVVTAIPTIPTHIRQRGFDHAELIARHFAKLRKHCYAPLLVRKNKAVQHGAKRKDRFEQAEKAFAIRGVKLEKAPILLIDDVFTTGATIGAAAKLLAEHYDTEVWTAITTRQSLDHKR